MAHEDSHRKQAYFLHAIQLLLYVIFLKTLVNRIVYFIKLLKQHMEMKKHVKFFFFSQIILLYLRIQHYRVW